MTPYQLCLVADVYKGKREEESKEKITLAYINAMWTIQWLGKKKDHPKPLNEILEGTKSKKSMTDKEMLQMVKNLNAIFGGEVE